MNRYFLLLTLIFSGLSINARDFTVISYNIRLNTANDGINAWPNRAEWVTNLLKFYEADIFGLQEVLSDQLDDIEKGMPQFGRIGTGRDDGKDKGEYNPIFYHKDKFKLLDRGQFWLSETPNEPGLGWDAVCNRICTWGRFKEKKTGIKFFLFNTHFDHKGDVAREKSAILIRDTIMQMNPDNLPVILTGDFNLTPDKHAISLIKKELNDSRDISKEKPYGPKATFNGFKLNIVPDERIDYIFVNNKIKVLKHGVLTDSKEQRYPSDHFPILVKLELK